MAEQADRYALYQRAVQEPEADVEFAIAAYREHFGRRPYVLREDFCGTAAISCAWVQAHRRNRAWGVDLDAEPLAWADAHNLPALGRGERRRLRLVRGDVCSAHTEPADVVMAQNFSYFLFTRRRDLLRYFRAARRHLRDRGILLLDAYGGPESIRRSLEETEYEDFSYVWDQDDFDPIQRLATCHIHFRFPDGSRIRRAFSYRWRMYTIPEIREALQDAGFADTAVYWEGTDPDTGEGDGVYARAESAEPDDAWVCYIVGVKR